MVSCPPWSDIARHAGFQAARQVAPPAQWVMQIMTLGVLPVPLVSGLGLVQGLGTTCRLDAAVRQAALDEARALRVAAAAFGGAGAVLLSASGAAVAGVALGLGAVSVGTGTVATVAAAAPAMAATAAAAGAIGGVALATSVVLQAIGEGDAAAAWRAAQALGVAGDLAIRADVPGAVRQLERAWNSSSDVRDFLGGRIAADQQKRGAMTTSAQNVSEIQAFIASRAPQQRALWVARSADLAKRYLAGGGLGWSFGGTGMDRYTEQASRIVADLERREVPPQRTQETGIERASRLRRIAAALGPLWPAGLAVPNSTSPAAQPFLPTPPMASPAATAVQWRSREIERRALEAAGRRADAEQVGHQMTTQINTPEEAAAGGGLALAAATLAYLVLR